MRAMLSRFGSKFQLVLIVTCCAIFLSGCSVSLPNFSKEPTAGLQVVTGAIPSTVFLNGQYLDKTPLIKKNLRPAEYTIEIRPDDANLVPYQTSLKLAPSLLTVITWKPGETPEQSGGVIYEMEPLAIKNTTEVSFTSIPDGAIVELADFPKDFTPVVFKDVPAGEQAFTISLPSYLSQEHTINVVPGYRMLVTVKLAKQASFSPSPSPTQANQATTATPSASPSTATASARPAHVTILPTNYFVNGQEVLRVRNLPSVSADQVGLVAVGRSYQLLEGSESGWLQIQIGSGSGWISEAYTEPSN